jgi:hypothetical protein
MPSFIKISPSIAWMRSAWPGPGPPPSARTWTRTPPRSAPTWKRWRRGVQTSGSGGIAVRRRRRTAFTWIFEPRPRCVTRWNAWSTSALSWSTGTTTLRSCSIRKATSSASSSDRVRVPRLIERPWHLAPSTVVAAGFSDVDIRRVPRSTAHTSARLERSAACGRSRVPVS